MVADVYSAFALAFKKPAGAPKEAFFFEVSLEIRENQDVDHPAPAALADGANFDSVPRQKNMFKLKRDVDKKVVITVSQISKVSTRTCSKCWVLLLVDSTYSSPNLLVAYQ